MTKQEIGAAVIAVLLVSMLVFANAVDADVMTPVPEGLYILQADSITDQGEGTWEADLSGVKETNHTLHFIPWQVIEEARDHIRSLDTTGQKEAASWDYWKDSITFWHIGKHECEELTVSPNDCTSAPEFNVSQVPLPPALWLLGSAILALVVVARRKLRA
jgi:hypothetical protein